MRRHPHRATAGGCGCDAGFTIVEVMMACLVLVVGMLGVLSLISGALRTTKVNNERVGATNLARQLIEQTRALAYEDMAGSLVQSRLQAGGELGSGSPWTFTSRGVAYTISAASCTYDDPTDRLASPAPDDVCLPQPVGSTGDPNGDDVRRTTFRISWPKADAGAADTVMTQTTLVSNPSGGLGPRIVSFTPVSQEITTSVSSVMVDWTTTAAQSLRWTVDDGASAGSSSGTTSFRSTWDVGSVGGGSGEILDGSYQVSAQPFDDHGVAGEVKRADIVLNRRRPYAPTLFAGGHDTRLGLLDLQWSPNRERDIQGYRVERVVALGDDVQVCPAAGEGSTLAPGTTSCAVFGAPTLSETYRLVAIDRAANNQSRDGDATDVVVPAASEPPAAPSDLVVDTVNGHPKLSWTAPASGSVTFYRVYRDGTAIGYDDRYDRTSADETTYTDSSATTATHRYWVTAIDSAFNESEPIGPVTWPTG